MALTNAQYVKRAVAKRERERGEKRIVVSVFVPADKVAEAKEAMRETARRFLEDAAA